MLIHLTSPINQEFPQGSKGGDIQPDPLFPGRPEGSMEEALPASLPNPSFVLQPHQQAAIFIPAATRIAEERHY